MELTDDIKKALAIVPVEWNDRDCPMRPVGPDRGTFFRYALTCRGNWSRMATLTDHEAGCLIKEALRQWLAERHISVRMSVHCQRYFVKYGAAFVPEDACKRLDDLPEWFDDYTDALVAAVLAVDVSDGADRADEASAVKGTGDAN